MKRLSILLLLIAGTTSTMAQGDFKTQLSTAKKSYNAGKLEEAHFALQQALQELDIVIGKEVLKLMPQKLDSLASNSKDDKVTVNAGFIGATIHRSYGIRSQLEVEIINNSPMIGTLNTFLNSSLLGGMMRDENTKVVKVQGYKARLEKQGANENGSINYTLQIPFNNALMSITSSGLTESQVLAAANSFPIQEIAKLIQ
ncbi:MAG TPA: hypothetical protein PKC39_07420 [Ferruginibacter sp.]|nr:hypothetical protein [Ferruginibacter sp.]HMP20772.1 hypothetical protein [Ferruginibacter sp.]